MSVGNQINYSQLLQRHKHIRIPMIQRDYAQGRPEEAEVREAFLSTLKDALCKPADDPSLPLNLDFIYGSVEGQEQTRFHPLDGQQRLTTLFLLHWYLAWRDKEWVRFEMLFLSEKHSRFSYSVRPSSNEFFDELVQYRPCLAPENVLVLADLIIDQPWYFRSWRLDPTIQAILHMLNAIHDKFKVTIGLFMKLIDEKQPVITFQLLDLKNFGLTDDLYIKMNGRGKPLTAFETFKARYEQQVSEHLLGEQFLIGNQPFSASAYVARRLDTAWADLFWKHRKRDGELYDHAFMNVFRAIALISRNPESDGYNNDISILRASDNPPTYTDFHSHKWLDEKFTRALICLLDSWCSNEGQLHQALPDTRYFDEKALFDNIIKHGAVLTYVDLVLFVAYALFLQKHGESTKPEVLQEWMRVTLNLALNTGYNRSDDFRRSVLGLATLLQNSDDILTHFATASKPIVGFNELQITEEKLKAKLILANCEWRSLLDQAEGHGYFKGQIGFLLDFADVFNKASASEPASWSLQEHRGLQEKFKRQLALGEAMFTNYGLRYSPHYCWQRALLCLGDYLLQSGRNRSFLLDRIDEEASWKRLLSGSSAPALNSRNLLKSLFNRLTPEKNLPNQLNDIINGAANLSPWREILVKCPLALAYCERKCIRVDESGTIYLLKRSQMNGAHAELYTYCLYQKLKLQAQQGSLAPLALENYYDSNETSIKPRIRFCWKDKILYYFDLEWHNQGFILYYRVNPNSPRPRFVDYLAKDPVFMTSDTHLIRKSSLEEIHKVIEDFRCWLVKFTTVGEPHE